MDSDEQVIRSLIAAWMQASAAGDLPRVLELMDDDVVFLGPGRPPMRGKQEFAAAFQSIPGRVEGRAEPQEIRVFGDLAYCWNQLEVTVYPEGGGSPIRRGGPALAVWRRKPDGHWVIFRDANMVGPAK